MCAARASRQRRGGVHPRRLPWSCAASMAKSAWRLAFVSPRLVLPRARVRARATLSATQLGYARTTCASVLIQA